ncbi:MAG: DUF697 domain-containing protein [Candidatus Magnetomorum sp.]|nr:DUF697 domain-containing protein [Candidatus Magnetomorum sp.]
MENKTQTQTQTVSDNAFTDQQFIPTQENIDNIIKKHVASAMGVGLIPMPVVDIVAIIGVQLNLLRKLAKAYNIPFDRDKGKNLIASFTGGGLTVHLGSIFTSFLKTVPVIGPTAWALGMPATAGASTYAIGKVFTQHFASGGTFLNMNPDEVKEYYNEMFEKGKLKS